MEDIKKYENMTVQEKWSILAMVANLYYNSEMTQNEIADRMYTSRSKISRMLKEARELGIVEISIKEPWERDLNLEKEIQQTYGVKTVRVVSSRDTGKEQITSRLSEVSAYYLDSVVKEKMVVGISWGNTLYHIVKYIDANNKKKYSYYSGSDYGCLKCETSGTGCHGSGKRPGVCIRWNISVYLCPSFCEK